MNLWTLLKCIRLCVDLKFSMVVKLVILPHKSHKILLYSSLSPRDSILFLILFFQFIWVNVLLFHITTATSCRRSHFLKWSHHYEWLIIRSYNPTIHMYAVGSNLIAAVSIVSTYLLYCLPLGRPYLLYQSSSHSALLV